MTLIVRDVRKRYGSNRALRGAGFVAHPGEVLALIGPNGSGKTTLLECVAGLRSADGGEVLVDGAPVAPAARRRQLIHSADGIAPWRDLSLGAVLDHGPRLLGAPVAAERLRSLIDALALGDYLDHAVGTLSKGQRKRGLLALALLAPQRYVLLDEPFDGLDLRQVREVSVLLRQAALTGRALVLSIQQLVDAARVADRFALLDNGRSAAEGTLAELRSRTGLSDAPLDEAFLALT